MMFTIIFMIELIMKLVAFGLTNYLITNGEWNKLNIFDGFVVIVTFVEVILQGILGENSYGFSVLRVFRMLRIMRTIRLIRQVVPFHIQHLILSRIMPGLWAIIEIIMNSMQEVINVIILLLLFMIIFAVLGMQLFGGTYTESVFGKEIPRTRFDNIFESFLAVFRARIYIL
jgi:hypothetical protein